jgi:hypothetical protein
MVPASLSSQLNDENLAIETVKQALQGNSVLMHGSK